MIAVHLLLFNIIITFFWMGIFTAGRLIDGVIGFCVGLILIEIFHPIFIPSKKRYTYRMLALIQLIVIFVKELIKSNIHIAYTILFVKNKDLYPDIVIYNVSKCSKLEILILSHMITLTPGTSSIMLSRDYQQLYVHAINAANPASVRKGITTNLLQPLLRVIGS